MHRLKSLSDTPVLLVGLIFWAVSPLAAQAADPAPSFSRADLAAVERLRARAQSDETAYRLVESLTTEVGPRPAGSSGDKAAVAWGLREMQRLGFANVHAQEVLVPHWVRGEAELSVISPFRQTIPTLVVGGSIGTPSEGIEADVVMVADLDALAALPADAVRDKIVFFDLHMARTRDGSGYGKAVGVRALGPSNSAALGAVAVVIRSMSTSDTRFPHTGATRYAADKPRIPGFAISNPDADALERQFATGKTVRMHLRSTSRDLPQEKSANIIGEIPGTDRADEIVIVCGHLDSWDPGVGAIDDGAGVAIAMGVGNLLKQLDLKPRRTIRVVLFANEEFGGSGSAAYLAANESTVDKHAVGFEADLGAGPVWRLASRVNEAQLPVVDAIFKALGPLKLQRGANDAAGGADLDGLAKRGMPLLDPSLDANRYFDVHHTANDTMAQVDPAALRQSVAAFATAAWLAAQYPGRWERVTTPKPAR
jgi:carboxypeptidase Q